MKRLIAGILLSGLVWSSTGVLSADSAPAPQDLNHYLADLQVKLAHTAQRANQPTAGGSSVVGLRGAQQQSGAKQLYWKGVDGDTVVNPAEVKLFRTAVDQANAGKKSDAIATLQQFQKDYPKSGLIPDVDETLNRLTTAQAPPAAPATITPSATQSVPAHS